MRGFFLPGVVCQGHDLFPFQVGQTLVVAVAQGLAHNLLHDFCISIAIKSDKGIVVDAAINEFDIDRHMSLTDQQIVVQYTPNPPVAIDKGVDVLKGQMKSGNAFDDILLAARLVANEHLLYELGKICRVSGNMAANAHPLTRMTDPAGDVITDVTDQHFV